MLESQDMYELVLMWYCINMYTSYVYILFSSMAVPGTVVLIRRFLDRTSLPDFGFLGVHYCAGTIKRQNLSVPP